MDTKIRLNLLSICFLFLMSCNGQKNKEKETYRVVDNYKSEDCNLYKMIFFEGEYAFRVALSGACGQLSKKDYILDYKSFLSNKENLSLLEGKKYILFEFYEKFSFNEADYSQLVELTEELLETQAEVHQKAKERLVIKIKPNL